MSIKLLLNDTNIFLKEFETKFKKLLEENIHLFSQEKSYDLVVLYFYTQFSHEDSIFDNEVVIKDGKGNISDALSIQVDKVKNTIKELKLAVYNISILGDNVHKVKDYISFEFKENADKKRFRGTCIAPDLNYMAHAISEIMNEKLSKIFIELIEKFGEENICQILNIPFTNDVTKIYSAFFEQHQALGLFPNDDEKQKFFIKLEKLLERLKSK